MTPDIYIAILAVAGTIFVAWLGVRGGSDD